ncbi:MAG: HupE/UreJ family protein [Vicinamibacterales bacterium]
MRRDRAALVALAFVCCCATLRAHPAPFSYLDLLVGDDLGITLVAHNIDVAHELDLDNPQDLLDPAVVARARDRLDALLHERLTILADGAVVAWRIDAVAPAKDRDAVEFHAGAAWPSRPGRLTVRAWLFPYDGTHQTFVNVYEGDRLRTQDILNADRQSIDYFTGTTQGALAVVTRFARSGVEHIFGGPDHVAFIVGLLLLGGGVWRLLTVMTAFTVAHSLTLSLAALDIVSPPARLIEPAIALSIVYVGADNLLVGRTGRDVRAWVAFFFGLVHGFGFASVLREFGLPASALGWALFAFNLGVEVGQAAIVLAIGPGIAWLQRTRPHLARRVAVVGSWVVVAAGAYWFVTRALLGP